MIFLQQRLIIKKNISLFLCFLICINFLFAKEKMIPENPRLEKIICKSLGKRSITQEDLLEVKTLFVNAKFGDARTLDGIDKLVNLENLIIYPGKITTLQPITKLKNLTYISISRNPIEDFEIIGNFSHLTGIDLDHLQKLDISFMENLHELKEITILFCGVKNIDCLKNLNPEEVYLWNNEITELPDLSNWTNIKKMDVAGNPIASNTKIVDSNQNVRMSYFNK